MIRFLQLSTLRVAAIVITTLTSSSIAMAQQIDKIPCIADGDVIVDESSKDLLLLDMGSGKELGPKISKFIDFDFKMSGKYGTRYGICSVIYK